MSVLEPTDFLEWAVETVRQDDTCSAMAKPSFRDLCPKAGYKSECEPWPCVFAQSQTCPYLADARLGKSSASKPTGAENG